MASFVTMAEYEAFVGTIADMGRASLALDAACDAVRLKLCQQIDYVEDEEIVVQGSGTNALLLPELPVVEVTTVLVDGVAVTDYTVGPIGGLLWRDDHGVWPQWESITVTYTHGFVEIPGDIKLATFQMARSLYDSAAGGGEVRQVSLGSAAITYESSSTASASGDPLASLARRVVKRVPVS